MTKAGPTGGSRSPRAVAREARAERLAAAHKANLRRRKAQGREQQVRERSAPPPHPPQHAEEGGEGDETGLDRNDDQDS
jgi:hypothetical protein